MREVIAREAEKTSDPGTTVVLQHLLDVTAPKPEDTGAIPLFVEGV
jgi:hypothetical protein